MAFLYFLLLLEKEAGSEDKIYLEREAGDSQPALLSRWGHILLMLVKPCSIAWIMVSATFALESNSSPG